jgi:DNA repair exonuclease SbcCD ATPase subunit
MASQGAHIGSPDVIKTFRVQFVAFSEESRRAVESVQTDVTKVEQWLSHEQMAYWTSQLRRREELVEHARSEYAQARYAVGPTRKISFVDEKKALDRAVALRDEAEAKLRTIKRSLQELDSFVRKSLGPCVAFASSLAIQGPQALARLDRMLDSLDEYLRPGGADPRAVRGAGP